MMMTGPGGVTGPVIHQESSVLPRPPARGRSLGRDHGRSALDETSWADATEARDGNKPSLRDPSEEGLLRTMRSRRVLGLRMLVELFLRLELRAARRTAERHGDHLLHLWYAVTSGPATSSGAIRRKRPRAAPSIPSCRVGKTPTAVARSSIRPPARITTTASYTRSAAPEPTTSHPSSR